MVEPGSDDGVELPERVEITEGTITEHRDRGELAALCLRLYQEATALVVLSSASYRSDLSVVADRNQAICAGLLVRIAKFMMAVADLSVGNSRTEVVLALNRCITETIVNVQFFLLRSDPALYASYVETSLSTEREFYDLVNNNISRRGGPELPLEREIKASIERVARLGGREINGIDPRFRRWGGTMRDRYDALGSSDRYITEERMGSHAIHGTWSDLALHHIREVDGGFEPNWQWTTSQGELLTPVAYLAVEAAGRYLLGFIGDAAPESDLMTRISDLMERARTLVTASVAQ